MGAAAIPIILQGILAAINAAPQVLEVISSAKQLIDSLVTGKVISTEQQTALRAYVDAHAALLASGITVPSSAWAVEPDPK